VTGDRPRGLPTDRHEVPTLERRGVGTCRSMRLAGPPQVVWAVRTMENRRWEARWHTCGMKRGTIVTDANDESGATTAPRRGPVLPARPGTVAEIDGDLVPVEAWDEQGRALIVERTRGRLVPADAQDGFVVVYEADVIAIIPGGGWVADHAANPKMPGAEAYTTPIVAWVLKPNGFIAPFEWGGQDGPREVEDDEFTVLRHPNQRKP
jgi:hypothetical protein